MLLRLATRGAVRSLAPRRAHTSDPTVPAGFFLSGLFGGEDDRLRRGFGEVVEEALAPGGEARVGAAARAPQVDPVVCSRLRLG